MMFIYDRELLCTEGVKLEGPVSLGWNPRGIVHESSAAPAGRRVRAHRTVASIRRRPAYRIASPVQRGFGTRAAAARLFQRAGGVRDRRRTLSFIFGLTSALPVIAREGYTIIAVVSLLAVALVLGALQFEHWLWRGLLVTVAIAGLGFTLFFFRDPERNTPPEAQDHGLVAPADGRVVEVVQEEDALYVNGSVTRVSIFLSPLDVHVNRVPASGTVEYDHYRPGEYLVAWHPKASEKNERSELGVRHSSGTKVLFKQIAGAVARRIEYHIGEGDTVTAGDRFGIVKFGSRMDVLVPPVVTIEVEEGQKVRAGETIMGWLPPAKPSPNASAESADSSIDAAAAP